MVSSYQSTTQLMVNTQAIRLSIIYSQCPARYDSSRNFDMIPNLGRTREFKRGRHHCLATPDIIQDDQKDISLNHYNL